MPSGLLKAPDKNMNHRLNVRGKTMPVSRVVEFVVKTSKYCNLRCNYCYEFPYLDDKARMNLENIRKLFKNLRSSIEDLAIEEATFYWHGGEPFLVGIDFYEDVETIQKSVFGTDIKYSNIPQTNLTILTERHIAFIKNGGFFTNLGVSFDVYGDQRIDTKGRLRNDVVIKNLQKLIDHGIPFGAITVLARNTLPHIRRIYRFFDDLNIEHRILPYYRSTGSEQAHRHGLDYDELVGAFKEVFHEWLASEHATRVDPIMDYVRYSISYLTGIREKCFDRSIDERVFIVDVSGDVYGSPESYDSDYRYGNLFRDPFSEIVKSGARSRSIMLSYERMVRFCHQCPYYGACPGDYVVDATYEQRKLLDARGCPVRDLIDYIVDVFERTDLNASILETQGATAGGHPALRIA
jgi:uncharacterized protein